MTLRHGIAVAAMGFLAAWAVWLHSRDDSPAPPSLPASHDVRISVPAPPPTAPRPRPVPVIVPPEGEDENALSSALKQELYRYNEIKKNTLFRDDFDRKAAASFAGKDMLTVAARFLTESFQRDTYSSEDEDMRMALVDYVGDATLGRFSFEDREKARQLLRWLLDMPISLSGKESRQAKSLIGDRIDLMAYYTQLDLEAARTFVVQHRGQAEHRHLTVGYSNGLYWLGYGQNEIDQELAKTR